MVGESSKVINQAFYNIHPDARPKRLDKPSVDKCEHPDTLKFTNPVSAVKYGG